MTQSMTKATNVLIFLPAFSSHRVIRTANTTHGVHSQEKKRKRERWRESVAEVQETQRHCVTLQLSEKVNHSWCLCTADSRVYTGGWRLIATCRYWSHVIPLRRNMRGYSFCLLAFSRDRMRMGTMQSTHTQIHRVHAEMNKKKKNNNRNRKQKRLFRCSLWKCN